MDSFQIHNRYKDSLQAFVNTDPHLRALSALKYQYQADWWQALPLDEPGIYILTGGRQVGKSTSCKLLIKNCFQERIFAANAIFYLQCDEIFDPNHFSQALRRILSELNSHPFLLIVDEVTYVPNWDRVIKTLSYGFDDRRPPVCKGGQLAACFLEWVSSQGRDVTLPFL